VWQKLEGRERKKYRKLGNKGTFIMASSIDFDPQEIAPKYYTHGNVRMITITWDCGAAAHADFDESFTDEANDMCLSCKIIAAVTLPGGHAKCAGTAPTDGYNIEIWDEYDVDIFGGNLNGLSATLSEQHVPAIGAALMTRPVIGELTFKLTGNLVDDANGKLILFFEV
jgi:hypothetical protein